MKSADAFLEEVENKPVFYYIYCYYDEKLDVYHQPFFSKDEPEYMLGQLKGSIIKGQVDVKNLVDLHLVLLGKFDIVHGVFDILDEYQAIVNCNKFIKQPEGGKDA